MSPVTGRTRRLLLLAVLALVVVAGDGTMVRAPDVT